MSRQEVIAVELSLAEKRELAEQIITIVNDEIDNANGVFGGYSDNPFTKSAIESIKMKSICSKMQMSLEGSPYCGVTGNLIFTRSTASGVILNDVYVGSRFSFSGFQIGTLEHDIVSLNVPYDQFDNNSIFLAPEKGTYCYIQLTGVYRLVEIEDEETPVVEKVEEETPSEENTTETE